MKTHLLPSTMAMLAATTALAVAETIVATQTGPINDATTWGAVTPAEGANPPEAGDANVWDADGYDLTFGSETFHGGTLVLPTGSMLDGGIGPNLVLQNTTFDGGGIRMNNNIAGSFAFSDKALVIGDGGAVFTSDNDGRSITLQYAVWSGAGELSFTRIAGATGACGLTIAASNNLAAYSGLLSLRNTAATGTATLQVNAATAGSFGLAVSGNSRVFLNAGTDLFVSSLTLGGEVVAPGTYQFGNFTSEQQKFLRNALGATVSVGSQSPLPPPPATIRYAVKGGGIHEASTWDTQAVPLAGDTHTWSSGTGFTLTYTNATFHGGTFVLASGSSLEPSAAGHDPTFQNFTFDGGRIFNFRNFDAIFTFGSNTVAVTANGGTVSSNDGRSNRDVFFADGIWTGAGNLTFDNPAASDTPDALNVSTFRFQAGADLSGYTGTMIGINKAIIELEMAIPSASFALDLRDASRFRSVSNQDLRVTALSLAGTALPDGIYQKGNGSLSAEQEAFILSSGRILVGDVAEDPYRDYLASFGVNPEDPDAAFDADLDGDGLANGLEFALGGSNPDDSATANRPAFALAEDAGADHLTLSFLAFADVSFPAGPAAKLSAASATAGVTYQVIGSADLVGDDTAVEWLSATATGAPAGYQLHTVRLAAPLTSAAAGFLKVAVTRP